MLKFKYFSLAAIFALLLSGCSLWSNFTTFFNLYYNTRDLFDQAEVEIKQQKRSIFSNEELTIPATANQNLSKVIEKSSKILQFDANTAFVDEALMMLGKSFYYQKNYQKAVRKFTELTSTQLKSEYFLEAQLWIAKCDMALRNSDKGLSELVSVREKAKTEGEDEIQAETYVEEIKYRIFKEEYAPAIELAKEFIKVNDDDVINAEVVYEIGRLYEKQNDFNMALDYYKQVPNYDPSYDVEVNSFIDLGKVLRKTGKPKEALDLFIDMKSENKYKEKYDVIELETGITYLELNEIDKAISTLEKVDTTYLQSSVIGIARLKLGEIFEYKMNNFDSAATYYQRAASSTAPKEYLTVAQQKDILFKKYKNLNEDVKNYSRLYTYALDTTVYIQDSIKYADSVTSIRKIYEDVFDTTKGAVNTEMTQRINNLIKPVRPYQHPDTLRSYLLKAKYELANLYFTEFNLPDSAYAYYSDIINNYHNSPYESKTLFAIGSYYDSKGDSVTADSFYNIIYDKYKDQTNLVNAAAIKLNKPLIDTELDPAKELYSSAEKLMLNKNYKEAVKNFYNIYLEHPNSSYAPKALYTAGYILENDLILNDSAAAVYDTLFSKYSKTQYANSIAQKLNIYKMDKARQNQIAQDSLKNNGKLNISTGADSLNRPKQFEGEQIQTDEDTQPPQQNVNTQQQPDTLKEQGNINNQNQPRGRNRRR